MIETVPGVILAGGLSSRMGGGDKCLLNIGQKPVLQHVIDRLRPQVGTMALNANGDPARFDCFGLPVICDSIDGFAGPLAGVLSGLDWAAGIGASHIVTVAADTPFFPGNLVSKLIADAGPAPVALANTPDKARGHARHPTFGLWSTALREDLRAALGDGLRKVVLWTERHGGVDVVFETEETASPFFNVNTPADLEQANAMVSAGL